MKIKKGYSFRVVAGENIVVPLADEARRNQGIFKLNDQAAKLFQIFAKGGDVEDAAQMLVKTYGISEQEASSDTEEFVELLKSYNMIEN